MTKLERQPEQEIIKGAVFWDQGKDRPVFVKMEEVPGVLRGETWQDDQLRFSQWVIEEPPEEIQAKGRSFLRNLMKL